MTHNKNINISDKSYEKKIEVFASMLDKAVLSYPNLMKRSFVSGVFAGLGATVGVTLIFILLAFVFKLLGGVPFIGNYIKPIEVQVEQLNPKK